MKRARAAALIAGSAVAIACSGYLPPPWRVTYTQVVGVRAEAADEPERATLRPGERARVRVLLVGREPIADARSALAVCASAPGLELQRCAGRELTTLSSRAQSEDASVELVHELAVPSEAALRGATHLLITGVVCLAGEPRIERARDGALDSACDDRSVAPLRFIARVELASDAPENHHPAFAAEAIALEGRAWPALPQAAACLDGPAASFQESFAITVATDLEARDRDRRGVAEPWTLSSLVTRGTLDRKFSAIEPGAGGARAGSVRLRYRAPPPEARPELEPEMLAVFVLRDERGGTSWAVRALCSPGYFEGDDAPAEEVLP